MRKGNFFANFLVFLSMLVMCIYYVKYVKMDIFWLVSIVGLVVVSVIILSGTLGGINDITSIAYSFKRVRKIIYSLHIKDADNVWNILSSQTYLFKNKYLDLDMSNYKREMERIEEEGMIYNQADFKDYININRINGKVKKKYLDVIGKIVVLIQVIISMTMIYFFIESVSRYNISIGEDISKLYLVVKVLEKVIKPFVVLNVYSFLLLLEYVFFYKTSLVKMENEYNLFVSDFEKYVMPNAKNDLINNVLYLQQLSIQNTKTVLEDGIENTANNIKDIIIRNSESANEIDRHVEGIECALGKFNQSIEDLKLSIQDQVECTKLSSDNQAKTYKDVLVSLEQRLDNLVQEFKQNQYKVEDKESIDLQEPKEEVKKKRTSTKKAAEKTAKTKKTTTSTDEATTKRKTKTKSVIEESSKEQEQPVVKKKRGRKSKAEKEAELKAALEAAVQEADSLAIKEENTESKVESVESQEENTESKVESIESQEENTESKVESIESQEENTESKVESAESQEENTEIKVESIEKQEENIEEIA